MEPNYKLEKAFIGQEGASTKRESELEQGLQKLESTSQKLYDAVCILAGRLARVSRQNTPSPEQELSKPSEPLTEVGTRILGITNMLKNSQYTVDSVLDRLEV